MLVNTRIVLSDTKESRMNFGADMVSMLFLVSLTISCFAALQILLDKMTDEEKKKND